MTNDSITLTRRRLLAGSATGVAALATGGLLSACQPDAGAGGDSGPKGIDNVDPIQLPEPRTDILYPEGYIGPRAYDREPFSDGSQTFRVVVAQDAQVVGDWAKNKATAEMERRTGLKIEFIPVLVRSTDGTIDMTKINAMLSGGDLPDAFLGIPFTSAQLSLYGQQGLFVALDDYIETYSPMTKQAMADYPDLRNLRASADGNLYTMLGVNDCYHCRSSPGRAWVSQKYLDKVGMDMPTTTEELREVLLEFKGSNPSGESGFMPFASSESQPMDTFFMNAFLYNPGGDQLGAGGANGGWMRLDAGKVQFVPTLPEWREGLKYLHQLGQDGTLTRATFQMKDAELQQNGNKGLVGFTRAYWWGTFFNPINLGLDEPWRDYVAVPPLKGPEGVQYARWDHYGYTTDGLQITTQCSSPELLVQWVDYLMDLEATLWSYSGVLDENAFFAKEGDVGINGKQALYYTDVWPAPAGQSWSQYGVMYRSSDFRLGERVDPKQPTFEAGLYEAGKAYEEFAEPKEMQLPRLIFPDEDSALVADTAVAINSTIKSSLAKFSLGELDPNNDADWQRYVDEFQAMNLQPYLDIHQKVYDQMPK
ncbi:MAG TPA: extracellular solute-binding protein [Candidatus Avipropionibacterium avicola]|uniref:Extracellular solute-binding protein n=1 Tax=Candidatus Avipropionibacterium avicola TaxID=2840701 RepID=A0A9D1GUH7_9ACTN|nr:extracellular solute-binding protein [Candidatus Avipropionibacterium avicola]